MQNVNKLEAQLIIEKYDYLRFKTFKDFKVEDIVKCKIDNCDKYNVSVIITNSGQLESIKFELDEFCKINDEPFDVCDCIL
jgi:hypothetical protein